MRKVAPIALYLLVAACATQRPFESTLDDYYLYDPGKADKESRSPIIGFYDTLEECKSALVALYPQGKNGPARCHRSGDSKTGSRSKVEAGFYDVGSTITTVMACFGTFVFAPVCAGVVVAAAGWARINAAEHGAFDSPQRNSDGTQTIQQTERQRLVSMAKAGDIVAAFRLGHSFANDQMPEAWKWLCIAANRGSDDARMELAHWHRTDIQYPNERPEFRSELSRDDRIAYLWFLLAEKGGALGAQEGLDYLSSRLSQKQIAEAEQMAREWEPGNCPVRPSDEIAGR